MKAAVSFLLTEIEIQFICHLVVEVYYHTAVFIDEGLLKEYMQLFNLVMIE